MWRKKERGREGSDRETLPKKTREGVNSKMINGEEGRGILFISIRGAEGGGECGGRSNPKKIQFYFPTMIKA